MFQFMGSRSGGPNGERTRGVTRGPKQIPIKLVAIAPDSVGVTHLESPRIWWWQSASTSPGEMMFQLETVTQPPVLVFKVKLNALPAGFNVLDPTKLGKDHKFRLNPGVEYSWVLTCFSGVAQNPVKGRVVRKNDLDLASFKATDPKRIAALSESKNWYELFDAVALPARVAPAGNGYVAIRQKLLDQAGLGGEMKAP